MKQNQSKQKGFTLLEVLLVVGIISILAGIVIIAINPSKQLGDTKNAQRRSDVNTIINAVYQYKIDNSGSDPASLQTTNNAASVVCDGLASCTGITDLSALTTAGKYLVAIPRDPSGPTSPSTGYKIYKNTTSGRITVDATITDNSAVISVSK